MTGFSAAKMKAGVAQAICRPAIGKIISGCFHQRIPSRGLRFDTSSPRIRDEEKAAIFWQLYEGAELRLIRNCLRDDLDVVELGCSIGVTSSTIRSRLGRERRLVCLEADSTLLDVAVRNLELNRLAANVQAVHGAIDYEHERSAVPFSVAAVNFGGRVSGDFSRNDISDELPVIFVRGFTLSELLQEYGISEYVLVADIEGSEAGILLRDRRSLRMCRQAIIELHDTHLQGRRITSQELVQAFIDLGFVVRARRGRVCCFERKGATEET
jgi:FkbM family methyltransferase